MLTGVSQTRNTRRSSTNGLGGARERRRHPRVTVSVALDFAPDCGSNFYAGRARDLSRGGLFVEAQVEMAPGTPLTVRLELLGERHELNGLVAWNLYDDDGHIAGFGVELQAPSARAKAAIERYMAARAPVAYECAFEDAPRPPPLPG